MQVDFTRFMSPWVRIPVKTLYSEMVVGEYNALMFFVQFPEGTDYEKLWQRVYEYQADDLVIEADTNGPHVVLMAYGEKVDEIAADIIGSAPSSPASIGVLMQILASFPSMVFFGIPYPFKTPAAGHGAKLFKKIVEALGLEEG